MSHIWMSHVTHTNEPCRTYEWVMSHIWMSRIWICHVTRVNESCHTCEWVMSHVWMGHVASMNESCHTYEWIVYTPRRHRTEQFPKPWKGLIAWRDSFICVMRLVLYIYECLNSPLRVTWLTRMSQSQRLRLSSHVSVFVRHASDMTHSHVSVTKSLCETYEWHDSVFVRHASDTKILCETYEWAKRQLRDNKETSLWDMRVTQRVFVRHTNDMTHSLWDMWVSFPKPWKGSHVIRMDESCHTY